MAFRAARFGAPATVAGIGAAIAVTVGAVATAVIFAVLPRDSFPQLVPKPAPRGWLHATLPNGTAVLFYPRSLHPIAGDSDAVSVASMSRSGAFLMYLNATPRQGGETLRNWSTFRLRLLRSDIAAAAHEDVAAQGVRFRGGTGSCVIDDYVTRIGAHHYEEIACLAQGHTSASVIVGAAPAGQWSHASPLLEQAVAAYLIR